ncbi:hypothetical protein BKA70DRAFT_871442 [Coprinopsis sp. MPI-PUGE-AT-0042]|nr:hypothetical protein BKA70DRAFT_871442 [Coprinopsis sp. MPI-PUGE-AT-0042]
MFSVNNGTDGHSDDHPIVLEGYKSQDFDALVRIIVPKPLEPSPPKLAKEEWISVLKLSTIWQMDKIRALAIEGLSRFDLSPLEKIVLAREYTVSKWLSSGVTTLVGTLDKFKIEDIAQTIGWETTARIYAAHSAFQKTEFSQKLKQSQAQSVPISRLVCIGCNRTATETTTQDLVKGCLCGGQKYEARVDTYSGRRSVESKTISGYKLTEQAISQPPFIMPFFGLFGTTPTIVTQFFGPEIEAMNAAAS